MPNDDRKLPKAPRLPRIPTPPASSDPNASRDSFGLTPMDRQLLEKALTAAARADTRTAHLAKENEERYRQIQVQLDRQQSEINELRAIGLNVTELKNEVHGTRADVRQLTKTVMDNLGDDIERERLISDVRIELSKLSADAGGKAGRESGAKWGAAISGVVTAAATIVWLIVWAWAAARKLPTPPPPMKPTNAIGAPAATSR